MRAASTAKVITGARVLARWPVLLAAALVCGAAVALYVMLDKRIGYAMLAAGVLLVGLVLRRFSQARLEFSR